MANFCLIPQAVDNFKKALKSREIDPAKLAEMDSKARRDFLEKYVGKDNAVQVNALFESKLLLKNQKAGMISWAKKVSGITPEIRRDLLAKIEKLDKVLNPAEEKAFLQDLANTRLGIEVTQAEAKQIFDLSTKVTETKAKWEGKFKENPDMNWKNDTDRLAYGWSKVQLEKYVNERKLAGTKTSFREQPLKKSFEVVTGIPGFMKSTVASLDNSFWGRQGIKTLLDIRTSNLWFKNFLKSFKDMAQQALTETEVMDAIRADIYSRPNAINGKYKAGGYGLDVFSEEAFPSSLPEKIPVLGNAFKASEVAYNGGALRLRADLADRLIKVAERQGINTLDPRQAEGMGRLINSMTGRGSLGKAEVLAKEANALLFSVKFLKSNFDTLTAHMFDSKATPFVRKEAAKSLLSIVASTASILGIAKAINPDIVDEDPRSTNFGKIKIFGQWTDITGGMAPFVTLAARVMPTLHDNKWSFWSKSKSGAFTDLSAGAYGQKTALDVIEDFFEGKLSPVAGIFRDWWAGQTYDGKRPTALGQLMRTTTPLSVQKFNQLMEDPNAENIIATMIIEGLGLSSSTTTPFSKTWDTNPTKGQQAFRDAVGNEKFNEANDKFNSQYNTWYKSITSNDSFKKLSQDDQQEVIKRKKESIQEAIFKSYGFKYKSEKRSKAELDRIKNLAN